MQQQVNELFAKLDTLIDTLSKDNGQLKGVDELYLKFRNRLKSDVGTSSGFTGLSEYLITRLLKRHLERNLQITFESKEQTRDIYQFYEKRNNVDVLLWHGANVRDILKLNRNIHPDLAVLTKDAKNQHKLHAVFEIKIYKVSPKSFENSIKNLKAIQKKSKNTLFFVVVLFAISAYKKRGKFMKFLEKNPDKAFLIQETNSKVHSEIKQESQIKLDDAFQKISNQIRSQPSG